MFKDHLPQNCLVLVKVFWCSSNLHQENINLNEEIIERPNGKPINRSCCACRFPSCTMAQIDVKPCTAVQAVHCPRASCQGVRGGGPVD